MEKKIDLHIHTNKSDGAYSPIEVIDLASKAGVNILAIADHDTIDAYDEELFEYALKKGIKIIPAVEISTKTEKCGIHVLGYNIDIHNQVLKDNLYQLRNARHIYLNEVAFKLKEHGYLINTEKLDAVESVTKAHIALDVINNKSNEELLIKEFGHIPNKGEFIETIMNENCSCYVKKKSITPEEAVKLIVSSSGKAVLAHPVAYKYEDSLTEEDILNLVKEMNIDAIEANYVYVDKNNIKINEVDKWMDFADRNKLHYTIGSDFHDFDGIRPTIGLIGDLDISLKTKKEILDYIED